MTTRIGFVQGTQLAQGVANTLVTARVRFQCEPCQEGWYRFEVAAADARFFPVACLPEIPGGKADGNPH